MKSQIDRMDFKKIDPQYGVYKKFTLDAKTQQIEDKREEKEPT